MKHSQIITIALLATTTLFFSCKNEDKKKEEPEKKMTGLLESIISYPLDSSIRNNFAVWDASIEGRRPVVFVIHEWWGLNDYAKMRARELAKMGYYAIALDMYGDGKMGNDPQAAEKLAMPLYLNPEKARSIYRAALDKINLIGQIDTTRIAVIGYCFGGAMAINLAKMGEDLDGVVGFHGNLNVVPADKNLLKAAILVCHGTNDAFAPMAEVDQFKKQMDSIGARYTVKLYEGATHAFTNPQATELGEKFKLPIKYDAKADSASWSDMKTFLKEVLK